MQMKRFIIILIIAVVLASLRLIIYWPGYLCNTEDQWNRFIKWHFAALRAIDIVDFVPIKIMDRCDYMYPLVGGAHRSIKGDVKLSARYFLFAFPFMFLILLAGDRIFFAFFSCRVRHRAPNEDKEKANK